MDELIRTAYIRGPLGPRGPQGPVGPKGEQGPIGLKGDKGDMGPMGPRGPQGTPFTYEDFTEDQLEGLRGPQGPQGEQGPAGQDGSDGADGQDGAPGQDGHTPVITASKSNGVTTVSVDGEAIATINDGQDGSNGTNGTNGTDGNDGTDGITPTVTVTSISNGHNVAFSYGTGDSRNVDFNVMDGDVANQLQADWNLTNSSYADYIKNKPTLFSGSYNDLTDKPTIPSAPDLTNYVQKSSTSGLLKNDGTIDTNTYLTSHLDISGKANTADLATVATSGSYIDLSNKPSILSLSPANSNNHTYVDLGLPSGTLWATTNIGASSLTDIGNYYAYGKGNSQHNGSDSAYSGVESPLSLSVDTARQVWSGDWHMPTKEQYEELIAYTTYTYEYNFNSSGVNGAKFTASNGNYIFLPASGYLDDNEYLHDSTYNAYYLTSSSYSSNKSYCLLATVSNVSVVGDVERKDGRAVRGVLNTISKVSTTGSYNDLLDKPTIPAALILSNWNQSDNTLVDYIKNKPDIFSGNGTLLSPSQSNIIDLNDITTAGIYTVYVTNSNYIQHAPSNVSDSFEMIVESRTILGLSFVIQTIRALHAYGNIIDTRSSRGGSWLQWDTLALSSNSVKIWSGTQAQYDLLTPDDNTIYIITSAS